MEMKAYVGELKKLGWIAGPVMVVSMLQLVMQTMSLVLVGHLNNELYLSSFALGSSVGKVTGNNFIKGMTGAVETLAGQAHGAKNHEKVGIVTQTAIIAQLAICIPIAAIWIFMDKILLLIHQDPAIAHETGKYMRILVINLFANAVSQPLLKYFQSQSYILPMIVSTLVGTCLHVPISWALMYKMDIPLLGTAISMGAVGWLQVIMLYLFMRFSSTCKNSRITPTTKALDEMGPFFRLAIPSAIMVCLEFWSFQAVILMGGLLKNPKLQISVLSLCLSTLGIINRIPFGLGCGTSTRVANELGAGSPDGARRVVRLSLSVVSVIAVLSTLGLYFGRYLIGRMFTPDEKVVHYYAAMAPFLCVSNVFENFLSVLIGVVKGCGAQKLATYVNMGAYFLCGIPLSVLLAFVFHLGGKGLWSGVMVGAGLQLVSLAIFAALTNWEKQAAKAKERVGG